MENPLDVLSRAASMLETNQITQGKMFYRIITPPPPVFTAFAMQKPFRSKLIFFLYKYISYLYLKCRRSGCRDLVIKSMYMYKLAF